MLGKILFQTLNLKGSKKGDFEVYAFYVLFNGHCVRYDNN